MTLNRRQLIAGGGAVVVAGMGATLAGPGRSLLGVLPFVGRHEPLDRTPMADRIGERFRTAAPGGAAVALTLVAVDDLPSGPAENPEGQFVAHFAGPAATPLGQGTYRFGTSSFGDVEMFVVPGADEPERRAYTAVFNRLAVSA